MRKRTLRDVLTSRAGRRRPLRRLFPFEFSGVMLLDRRILPTVTASFSAGAGLLRVTGDAADNTIDVSRNAAGAILVNNGAVAIQGDPATIDSARMIMIVGAGGNDNLALDETNGAMPAASIFGGPGDDVITAGSGSDFVDGGSGNDRISLGAGDDTFQWNPGDGSDVVDGQAGSDALVFNGSDVSEKFEISAVGNDLPFHRVRLTRDVGSVAMDLSGLETIELNPLGGADTITVDDQTTTDLVDVNLNLAGASGNGDGQPDSVVLNGADGNDVARIAAFDDGTRIGAVLGLFPSVNITGAEGTNDLLTVNTLGGDDTINASNVPADLIGLVLNGGAGNDTILGSLGNDLVNGGPGNDVALMDDGDDTFVWNPGDGSDTVDGQAGFDSLIFNGADDSENIAVSANGGRALLTRDLGAVAMDLNRLEDVAVNANGGADIVTVNNTSEPGLAEVNVNLATTAGGDGQTDVVVVNGTDGDDDIQIGAFDNGTTVGVGGRLPKVNIIGADGANDVLTVNALGGNDTINASTLPANLIGLVLNGGAGNDTILGSLGADLVVGGAGNDVAQMGDGADTFVWNPGDGSDTVDGQGGSDRLVFNGADVSENFTISASGGRVRLTRDIGGVVMDLGGLEAIDLNALGGADIMTINDTSPTDLSAVNLNLNGSAGGGDRDADSVFVNGTNGDDAIRVLSTVSGARITVAGLFPLVNITGADGTSDHLTVNALGGNDVVDSSRLAANLIGLTVNLGDGQGVAATTTTLRASTATAVFGQMELLTATVSSPSGKPTGAVTFLDGANVLGIVPVDAAGQAAIAVSLGVGNHALTAVYGGAVSFAGSVSAASALAVNRAATTVALASSNNPAFSGQSVTFTATVAPQAPGAGSPTGTVTFADGRVIVATVAVGPGGTATFTTSFAIAGGHAVTAIYSGDANFAGSSQALAEQVVARPAHAPTTTALTASALVVPKGQTVTFTATVRSALGPGAPTGTVRFQVGNMVVARVRLNAAGQASFKRRFTAKGQFIIRAFYSGDNNFAASAQSITERVISPGKGAKVSKG
jgi:Ca2+-binding RTX toxin-like protein